MFLDLEQADRPDQRHFLERDPNVDAVRRIDDSTEHESQEIQHHDRDGETALPDSHITSDERSFGDRSASGSGLGTAQHRHELMSECTQERHRQQAMKNQ
jgi:hypothetical protein